MKKLSTIAYWSITILLSVLLLFAAVGHISLSPELVENTGRLGFPARLMPFLGVLKILGVLALLIGRRSDLTVGAYAGIFFYGLGAAALHLTASDPIGQSLPALLISGFSLASYALWRRTRGSKHAGAFARVAAAKRSRVPEFKPERSTIVSLL